MAKDRFYRTKPHVNVGAIFGLQKLGFSGLGVFQILNAEQVVDPHDRKLAAEILENAVSGLPTGKRQHKPCSITRPQNPLVFVRPRTLGFSAQGIQQISLGHRVTDPQDLGLVAEVLADYASREVVYYTITLTNAR